MGNYTDLTHELADQLQGLTSAAGTTLVTGKLQYVAPDLGRVMKRITADQVVTTNASAAMTISTPDSSGQVVEPAVCYIPGGWQGHVYWALVTGYTNANNQTENPSLYYSDDGITFTPQPGVPFPIVGAPSGGYNDDPEILLGPDGKMHLFWLQTIRPSTNIATIFWCTYDGTTLTTPQAIIGPESITSECPIAPAVYWDGANTQWVMFYTDIANLFNSVNAAYVYKRRTCSGPSPSGTWSAPTVCTVNNLPASFTLWESHIEWYGDQLHMVSTVVPFLDNGTQTNIYFGVSNDNGNTWTMSTNPLLRASAAGNWDSGTIYRGDIVHTEDASGTLYTLYYSAGSGSNVWKMGQTKLSIVAPTSSAGGVIFGVPANLIAVSFAARATPLPPYVFGDSCVRANASVPGTADSGQAWTVDAGVPGITSNSMFATTTANTKLHATTGIADGYFSAEMPVVAVGNTSQQLLFRYQDANNFIAFGIRNGVYNYQTVVGGTTLVTLITPSAPANGDILGVRAQGQNIFLYINNQLVAKFANQSNLTGTTLIGLQFVGTTTATFRNITARSLVNNL